MPGENLPLSAKAGRQIFRDIVKHNDLVCKELLELRPAQYIGSEEQFKRSGQNRFNYIKGIEKTNPKLYAKLKLRFGTEDELFTDEEPPAEEEAERQEEQDVP